MGKYPDDLDTKAKRRIFLIERGWLKVSLHGAGSWQHPRYGMHHFFSLSAAVDTELREQRAN